MQVIDTYVRHVLSCIRMYIRKYIYICMHVHGYNFAENVAIIKLVAYEL